MPSQKFLNRSQALVLPALLASASALYAVRAHAAAAPLAAEADLVDVKGEKVGRATFIQTQKGVKITVRGDHLAPGTHGIHIHEHGACNPPKFDAAGKHFAPTATHHGLKNAQGPHAGDLPNLEVGTDGTAFTEMTTARVTLEAGKTSLLKEGGTAIVIHAKSDDQMSDPAGNSGDKIACGVIKRAEGLLQEMTTKKADKGAEAK